MPAEREPVELAPGTRLIPGAWPPGVSRPEGGVVMIQVDYGSQVVLTRAAFAKLVYLAEQGNFNDIIEEE